MLLLGSNKTSAADDSASVRVRFSSSFPVGELVERASDSPASGDVEAGVRFSRSPSGDFVAVLRVVLRSVVVCVVRFAGALERFEEGFSSALVFFVVGAFLPGADFFAAVVVLLFLVDVVVCLVVFVFLAAAVLPLALAFFFPVAAGCDDSSETCCSTEDCACDEPDLAVASVL